MTDTSGWPTLDGPDAERAIRDATAAVWTWEEGASAESIVAALNDRDVVLCDHDALAALRQRATDAEAPTPGASLPCGNCGNTPCLDGCCCPECTHASEYRRGWADGWRAAKNEEHPPERPDDVTGDVRQAVQ